MAALAAAVEERRELEAARGPVAVAEGAGPRSTEGAAPLEVSDEVSSGALRDLHLEKQKRAENEIRAVGREG